MRLGLIPIFLFAVLVASAATPFSSGPWVGAVTATSATTVIRLSSSGAGVRWVLSENEALTAAVYSDSGVAQASAGNAVKLQVLGLKPATKYFYGFEVGGQLRAEAESRGSFTTFPLGAASFKIAFASCGDFHHADQSAYDAIRAEQPLLFINTGDLHYSDTRTTIVDDYRSNYDGVLTQTNQAALYRSVPVAYVWDDHDFCGNDSDGNAPGRDTARRVYDERVPHYPLGPNDGTIGQAFTIGRVRVIMTDLRSASSDRNAAESSAKNHLGVAQKAWFKQELINARDAGFPLVLWVSSVPWIGTAGAGTDDWSKYSTERREIANFIKANRINNVVLLCGDMHALAYDDGTHSDYAEGGGAPLVVLHASALTSIGSQKGGPYTAGPLPGSQQYGILEITDNGGSTLGCTFYGKHSREGTRLTYSFTRAAPMALTSAPPASAAAAIGSSLTNMSSRDRITTSDGVMIVGFVIGGAAPRTVLVRAIGPTLGNFGLTDALADPQFEVVRGKAVLARNDDWAEADATTISTVSARVGAYALPGPTKDAAAVLTLNPGVYSVVAHSGDGGTGSLLVEIYDVP